MATTKKKVPFVPKQEIYTYDAPWTCYGLAWSNNKAEPYRLAVGSFVEEYVEIEREGRQYHSLTLEHSNTGTAIKYRS
jgi:phenolic acid decarboxylase